MNITIEQAASVLAGAKRALIAGHSDPDGDALGSMLGLAYLLQVQGCEVWLYREGALPVDYDFLPGAEQVKEELPGSAWPDLLVLLDCHQVGRAGGKLAAWFPEGLKVLVLDHHLGEVAAEFMSAKDPGYSATAELIALMARQANWLVSMDAAKCLYAAIMSDTGNFTQGNTTALVLDTAGWLVSKGANPEELSLLSHSTNLNRLRLHAMALMRSKSFADGRVFLAHVSLQDLHDYGCVIADLEGLVEPLRFIKGGLIAAILKQIDDNQVKVSIRSKRHVDVSKLAMHFGGGGHKNAAGFRTTGTLDSVEKEFLQQVLVVLEELGEGQAR